MEVIRPHLLSNNLINDAQFGFCQGHSAPDLILNMEKRGEFQSDITISGYRSRRKRAANTLERHHMQVPNHSSSCFGNIITVPTLDPGVVSVKLLAFLIHVDGDEEILDIMLVLSIVGNRSLVPVSSWRR
eukprot:g41408.t1